ncbi:hypothetical protein QEG73_19660 [Chitinophagaceae bacterium 26-R-25]|nr:hypothetical protein [Chitinophagaceae bacterium 26-R-25]
MEEKDKSREDAFMEAVINKMEKQDKKIAGMEEKLPDFSAVKKQLGQLAVFLDEFNARSKDLQTLDAKSAELLGALQNTKTAMLETKAKPVQHHHHFPKLLWALVGVSVVLIFAISELYMTYQKLDSYKAGDSKYRFLKLDTSAYPLQRRLYFIDSVYNSTPDFRTKVIEMEEERQLRLEQISKAILLRKEAEDLEKSARQNKTSK